MSLIDRLDLDGPVLSEIKHEGVSYIPAEYFPDGRRKYLSPIDLVVNGPKDGEKVKGEHYELPCYITITERHYETDNPLPAYITCKYEGPFSEFTVYIIVQQCELVKKKFGYCPRTNPYYRFVVYPDYWEKGGQKKMHYVQGEIHIAFRNTLGIPNSRRLD